MGANLSSESQKWLAAASDHSRFRWAATPHPHPGCSDFGGIWKADTFSTPFYLFSSTSVWELDDNIQKRLHAQGQLQASVYDQIKYNLRNTLVILIFDTETDYSNQQNKTTTKKNAKHQTPGNGTIWFHDHIIKWKHLGFWNFFKQHMAHKNDSFKATRRQKPNYL